MTPARRARPAFTLVEAITAIVLLGVAVPPMLWALRQGQAQRADPLMISRARWLAVERLEDVIADRHSPARGYAHLDPSNYPAEPAIDAMPGFSRSVTLAETGPDLSTPGEGYMLVTVEVAWQSPTAGDRSLSVSTVLTEHPSP